jgi:uncharacterized protein (DUF433 family)
MENLMDRITIDPDICGGKPTIRGQRITVQTILGFLSAGDSKEDILEYFPFLKMEDINACLKFASYVVDNKFEVKPLHG